ncbi:hypothetical protein [uncultured Sphaerochaeta sp.]|uniref:hypothetical protein n=1 Tax=uncultured Sphaerochaeta sp. TaxID=886478 RepID=UPI002AA6D872|nr:hypothetical protein [uncultured Sphaerochaeta sp.]
MKRTMIFPTIVLFLLLSCNQFLFSGTFPEEKVKSFADTEFIFPTDLIKDSPILIALNIGTSRENGEVQQAALIAWQDAVEGSDDSLRYAPFYHISVIEGAPFFVRGAIRRGLAGSFEGLIDPERGGVLFLSKAEKFAEQAEIPIDGEPTLVVVSTDGTITGYVKGEVNSFALSTLAALWEKAT